MPRPSSECWYVYVLECEDGSLYTGVTKDPKRRLAEHQAGGCRYTRSRRGVCMRRVRRCASKVLAYRYEYALKQLSRAAKLAWCERRRELPRPCPRPRRPLRTATARRTVRR